MVERINESLLLDIFRIASPSYKESEVAGYIKSVLSENLIDFTQDSRGNIYNISNENKPLLSAHMDTVQSSDDACLAKFINIQNYPKNKRILKGLGVIGGDDKCGVYIILEMLKNRKDLNFVFSVEEEVGGKGISDFTKDKDFSKIPYGIVLDRRFGTDIICEKNNYGTMEFQKDLEEIGKKYKYAPASGSFSDANFIRNHISCANLSVGYHNPHSRHEYVDLDDLLKAIKFVEEILDTLNKKYPAYVSNVSKIYDSRFGGYNWEREYDFESSYQSNFQKGIQKEFGFDYPKKERNLLKNKEEAKYIGVCRGCNKYTTIYRIKKVNTTLCSTCLNELNDEVILIDQIRDPFNDGSLLLT